METSEYDMKSSACCQEKNEEHSTFNDSLYEKEGNSIKKVSRNVSEKIRRDRLNSLIQELAKEVPIIATCQKKLDKSSILRLTSAYLKFHLGVKKMKMAQKLWRPNNLFANNLGQVLQEAVDGFLLVVSKKGTIILLSEAVGQLLGHNQFDLIGKDIDSIIHPEDRRLFLSQFCPRNCSSIDSDIGSAARSFYVRFLNINCRDNATYSMVHIKGQLQEMSLLSRESNAGSDRDVWLTGCGQLLQTEIITNISLMDSDAMEWVTQHAMDGKILYSDPRSCQVTGVFPGEQFGSNVYLHIVPEDMDIVCRSHLKIMTEGEVPSTVFRIQTLDSDVTYVESRSIIARDNWTGNPKFIVSLNTKLSVEEGKKKLDQQRQAVPKISEEEAKDLLSSIFKKVSNMNGGGNSANIDDPSSSDMLCTPHAYTNEGDILQVVNHNYVNVVNTPSVCVSSSEMQRTFISPNSSETCNSLSTAQSRTNAHSDSFHDANTETPTSRNVPFPANNGFSHTTVQSSYMTINRSLDRVHSDFEGSTNVLERSAAGNYPCAQQYHMNVSSMGPTTPTTVNNHLNSLNGYQSQVRSFPHTDAKEKSVPYSLASSSSAYRHFDGAAVSNERPEAGHKSFLTELLQQKFVPPPLSTEYSHVNSVSYSSSSSSSSHRSRGAVNSHGSSSSSVAAVGSYLSLSDSNVSVSSHSPQNSICTSPSWSCLSNVESPMDKGNEDKNHDAFQVFSTQLQQKHVEIDMNLTNQSSEIEKIEQILTQSVQHKNSPQYKNLKKRLIEIKANQNMMIAELEKLKQDVKDTNDNVPHSTNQLRESLSPDSSSTCPAAMTEDPDTVDCQMASQCQSPNSLDSHLNSNTSFTVEQLTGSAVVMDTHHNNIAVTDPLNSVRDGFNPMPPQMHNLQTKQTPYSSNANSFYASTY